MSKIQTKTKNERLKFDRLMQEDLIFLILALIDYPEKKPGILFPEQLGKFRCKILSWKIYFNFLLLLERDAGIKVKVMENNFPEIEVTEKAIKIIQEELDNYLKRFRNGELIPIDKDYFEFKKQEKYFLGKIRKKTESGIANTCSFFDSEIEDGYRLFETLLILEDEKYLKIKSIANFQKPESPHFYKISFEIKNKLWKKSGLRKKKFSPECFERGSMGEFRVKKNTRWKRIDHIRSRNYLLLKFLIDQGLGKMATFDKAFKAIDDGTHYEKKGYVDEKLKAFVNAKKFLQKGGKIKPLEIKIDKHEKNIWIE